MGELKERIKDFVGNIYFKWVLNKLKPEYIGPKEGNFLLLPPSDLDGSFGDELMVRSFVSNFAGNAQVTIFTDHLIRRDDFLGQSSQVKYKNGFQVRNYGQWAEALKSASAIFIIGADALDGSYSSRHSLRFFRLAEMAHKMQIPVYFSGFSVSLKLTNIAKLALENVAHFSYLKARDIDSYDRLLAFIPKDQLIQVSDMAFICPYDEKNEKSAEFSDFVQWAQFQHDEGRKIIAFCPNSIQTEKLGWQKYMDGIKSLIAEFDRNANISIAYLYHDIRPLFEGKSDKDISEHLYNENILGDNARCFFPNKIQNGVALKSYLKHTEFTMTGRMHFGISGLAAGKPMFGICYANKFEGMLRLFDIDPSISLVDYTAMNQLNENINLFLNDIENQYVKIEGNIEKINTLSYLNGKDIVDAR